MRRAEREIKEPERIVGILQASQILRLGLVEAGSAYIVPVNFGCEQTPNGLFLYVHGASAGRKAAILRQDSRVSFEADIFLGVKEHETGCGFTALYQSVMGEGRAELLTDPGEKTAALTRIMAHYGYPAPPPFAAAGVAAAAVYRIRAEWLTGKENR
ncbi:MAG: pyridoxamine 5'-phosphate oxidase family protein [Clostridiales bacterium]|jgi:nitroimidazol reductase NimA-like FMN-containing flavoprotein (pyridoxamine 5'-phosphate oxidase superfamily)|nr:pyridoxamine 5'-phosphate oxidase family protein [Clostridiales bacterium]